MTIYTLMWYEFGIMELIKHFASMKDLLRFVKNKYGDEIATALDEEETYSDQSGTELFVWSAPLPKNLTSKIKTK